MCHWTRPAEPHQNISAFQLCLPESKPFPHVALHEISIDRQGEITLWDNQPEPRKFEAIFANLNQQHPAFKTAASRQYGGDILSAEALFATIPELRFQIADFRPRAAPALWPDGHELQHDHHG